MLLDVTKPAGTERRNAVDFRPDLAAIRAMSAVLPGALPLAVNGVRVAASIRPRKFVIEGGDDTAVTMPRTAFQIVYPDCSVMIDSGLDKATHDSFSPDKPEPYFAEQFAKLQRALASARLIVLTHHHADHVAGVLCAPNFSELAGKTIITMGVADCMINTPHRPHLKLAQILHSVDSAWIMDNIMEVKGKAAPWVKEDVPQVMAQLRWLKAVAETEKNITILVTHDDELFDRQTRNGTIGRELAI